MSKHAAIEITEGLILRISASGQVSQVVAKAALSRGGARILYDALGEYLGLRPKSTGRARTTMFVGEDLTEHERPSRKPRVVRLNAPLGGVVRLRRGAP